MLIDPRHIRRLTSCGVLFNEKREVLLVLRNDMPLWEPPGGIVDDGETHEQAVIRETKEEIGCDTTIKRLLGTVYRKIDDLPMEGYRHFKFFELNPINTEIVLDEHIAFEWFALDKLPLNLAPLHRLCITYAGEENRPYSEEISDLLDGKAFSRTIDPSDIYMLKEWDKHPKVIVKREKNEIRYDPLAKIH